MGNTVWTAGVLWSVVMSGVGGSGGIWWLVGALSKVLSSSGISVIVIIESRRVWYWLMVLEILTICRFCMLVWLFLAVVALIAIFFKVCCNNVVCLSCLSCTCIL